MQRDTSFRSLLNTVPVLVWSTDAAGSGTYFNKVWLDFTGRTLEQEVGDGWLSNIHRDDGEAREALALHLQHHDKLRVEFRLRRCDGVWRWMLCRGVPRICATGEFVGFVGSCTDTTDVKEAQAQRQRDLDEKAAVMQELHHRVKNNAQVFASLLSVQASRADDPAVKAALRVAAARAATMAFAQQQIWDAGSSAHFDLGALVRRLVRAVPPRRGIEIVVRAPEHMVVPLATAVPLGLIVHELLTNALSHAYPGSKPGEIVVRLSRHPGYLLVTVVDDGIGMPDPEAASGRSAGLTIVRSLGRQLGATLDTRVTKGTTVTLRLPT